MEAKFFILGDVIFLGRLQRKFDIVHSWGLTTNDGGSESHLSPLPQKNKTYHEIRHDGAQDHGKYVDGGSPNVRLDNVFV